MIGLLVGFSIIAALCVFEWAKKHMRKRAVRIETARVRLLSIAGEFQSMMIHDIIDDDPQNQTICTMMLAVCNKRNLMTLKQTLKAREIDDIDLTVIDLCEIIDVRSSKLGEFIVRFEEEARRAHPIMSRLDNSNDYLDFFLRFYR